MRRPAYSEQVAAQGVDINMAPLIDMVFLLLIFFIATTVFVQETGVEVQKPVATSAAPLDKNSMLIALTPDGQIIYGGRAVTLNAVRGLVAQQARTRAVPVVILADQQARTGRLVELIDECKLAGARQVSVASTQERTGP